MKTINVRPVEISGRCRANLTLDDEFQIRGTRLENPRQSNLCCLALAHLPPIISQLQRENHFFAHVCCPECLSLPDRENRVVFLLGHADKWELCQAISKYRRLCRQYGEEPQAARQSKAAASQYQKQGDYSTALEEMSAALEQLKGATVSSQ